NFNPAAERATYWTRSQLEAPVPTRQAADERWAFLGDRPKKHQEDGLLFVHGSARNPLNEYVFPEDIYHPAKLNALFALTDKYCFQGHTHLPGLGSHRRMRRRKSGAGDDCRES